MKDSELEVPDGGRRPVYRPPRLTTYGPVHEVARQHGPGPMSDAGNNMMALFIAPPS